MVHSSAETRPSLLIRIRDAGDEASWYEFVAIYAPLIHAYGTRRGLQDADAADVAQQVLGTIARTIPKFEYDRAKGSFRGWLFTVTRHQVVKTLQQKKRTIQAAGDTVVDELLKQFADPKQDEEAWNLEHERQLFSWAAEKARVDFKPDTWRAFWAVAVEGRAAAKVAGELDLTTGAVYIAKCRVTARIRQWIDSVEQI